ncbi:L-ribulose-5-phosphate 3-epimerase UlaE [Anatilimnocola aggregata]|uniref:L-ribulose-5-phosphate 3-epimerase UlaE n=1 Tax=Anatilimnocola aggregata TaxID=2528021 RepID=A0A517YDV1_9BACT|nr:sugar phosphate isomerase/epimerase family protein [Anatilimnocola aggregata]QDU28406.1 L-ribulose-5-phosphate 3-epimerase UlaE [Anatilimnocola aggregata]
MRLGYNTNGWAHHDPFEAIELIADLGYRSVAITLDHGPLNPFAPEWPANLRRLCALLQRLKLSSVIETGARFLLDPRRKHQPTMLSADAEARARRVDFLRRSTEAAAELGSDCVSLWSGTAADSADDQTLLDRLAASLATLIPIAELLQVDIGFEPEPGMFIDSMSRFQRLLEWVDSPRLQVTLDLGHLYCQGEVPIADYIARWSSRIVNVHVEDMRAGVHEHLMFGEGEMEFPPILAALGRTNYRGGVHVELSRHSHEAPTAAAQAYAFLAPLVQPFAGDL